MSAERRTQSAERRMRITESRLPIVKHKFRSAVGFRSAICNPEGRASLPAEAGAPDKEHKAHKGRQQLSEKLRRCRCPGKAVLRDLRVLCGERRFVPAFTLIEMLVVIGIIAVLAAILITAVVAAMRKARTVAAASDIHTLVQALTQYNMDFGAFPPDRPFDSYGNPIAPFPVVRDSNGYNVGLNPNQCLVWFLTRTFANRALPEFSGQPAYYFGPVDAGNWTPSTTATVFASASGGPYFSPNRKQTTDFGGNGYLPNGSPVDPWGNPYPWPAPYGYPQFVDPWGRPYMYRAYAYQQLKATAAIVDEGDGFGPLMTITIDLTPADYYPLNPLAIPWPMPPGWTAAGLASLTAKGWQKVFGQVTLSDPLQPANNGTFPFGGVADNAFRTTGFIPTASTTLLVSFPLHNPQTCDLYSLGPNGTTRDTFMPRGNAPTLPPPLLSQPGTEWHPVDAASLSLWVQVWGTPGDGNDTATGNVLTNPKDQDDVNNW